MQRALLNSQRAGKTPAVGTDPEQPDIDALVRARLRAIRTSAGWSLDEIARRSHLSASTISRIETGRRTISLDVLVPLARALAVDLDDLLDTATTDDVVIRPEPATRDGTTTWALSRPTSPIAAIKLRLEPRPREPEQRVHPGHDWLFVLDGRILLVLGDRRIVVEAGEAAEFATMTPHAVAALDVPAEVLMLFDRDGRGAHLAGPASGTRPG
jgi:transcriptional regulator with XRE-family HTH domain